MSLTIRDKRIIVARNFFIDNQEGKDAYEDFREALIEFTGSQAPPDAFIEFAVQPYLDQRKDGHLLLLHPDGWLMNLRTKDDYMEPVTEMTDEQGETLHEEFQAMDDKFPDEESAVKLLQKIGWKII